LIWLKEEDANGPVQIPCWSWLRRQSIHQVAKWIFFTRFDLAIMRLSRFADVAGVQQRFNLAIFQEGRNPVPRLFCLLLPPIGLGMIEPRFLYC
jgi:hypothetical protein